ALPSLLSSLSMNRDSKTRMTNDEIRRNDQIRMTKPATAQLRAIGHSGFGFLSSLVIGHWSFVIQGLMHIRFMVPMRAKKSVGAFHEPAVPERESVTRRTWGYSLAPRLTEPRSGARVCDPQQLRQPDRFRESPCALRIPACCTAL